MGPQPDGWEEARPGQENEHGQAGYVAGDPSPLETLQTQARPVFGPPAVVSPEPSHSGRGPMLGMILHIPTAESKSHRHVASTDHRSPSRRR